MQERRYRRVHPVQTYSLYNNAGLVLGEIEDISEGGIGLRDMEIDIRPNKSIFGFLDVPHSDHAIRMQMICVWRDEDLAGFEIINHQDPEIKTGLSRLLVSMMNENSDPERRSQLLSMLEQIAPVAQLSSSSAASAASVA